jgi:uncharacterized protein YndB with AHSA1/START domain
MAEIRGYHRIWIDHTTEVDAPLAKVMALLSDLDQWASWTPGLSEVQRRQHEPVRVGTRFTLRIKPAPFHPPLPVPCKLYRLEPNLIEWGGDALGSVVRHRFELSELSPVRTRVRQLEYATNVMAVLARIAEPGILKHDLRWQEALSVRAAAA